MPENLPALPTTDDLVDRIAKEIAAEVAYHMETMYPAATMVVPWESVKRGLQGVIRNAVAAAGEATEEGRIEEWLAGKKRHRASMRRMRRQADQLVAAAERSRQDRHGPTEG